MVPEFIKARSRASRSGAATKRGRDPELDRELMRRIALQDRGAFEALYRAYAPRLGAYLSRILRQRDLVEECFDDVMVVVWQKADRFEEDKRVSTWLFGIAHNKALKLLEKRRRQPDLPGDDPDDAGWPVAASDSNFEQQLVRRDQLSVLARAIEELPPGQRAVLELTFSEGRSYAEIAEIAGIPINTVKTRMFHARRRLRQVMPGPFAV